MGTYIAAGAVLRKAETVLIEREKLDVDYLNMGCVPSKALLVIDGSRTGPHRRYQIRQGIDAISCIHPHWRNQQR